jgi:hypothetical protein
MSTIIETDMRRSRDDAAILELLGQRGSVTIEQLVDLSGSCWGQVFGIIDRLSRSGGVRLTRVGLEYHAERARAS